MSPDRRQNLDGRERIVALEARYQHIAWRLTVAVAIMGATLVAVSLVLVLLIRANSERAREIQGERARVVRENCVSQNARHDATVRAFEEIYRRRFAQQSATSRQLRANRRYNRKLIDAVVPHRDCAALVRGSVSVSR